jgi:hypothetical protein
MPPFVDLNQAIALNNGAGIDHAKNAFDLDRASIASDEKQRSFGSPRRDQPMVKIRAPRAPDPIERYVPVCKLLHRGGEHCASSAGAE